jgi:RNA polymerase sigma factor (sigma-70 family)
LSIAVDPPRAGTLGTATDQQLTELVRCGHEDAFTALYVRHSDLLTKVAMAAARDRCRAEDITQDAWASAYRALSRPGAPIDNVTAWLTTITRNAARDRFRREGTLVEVLDGDRVTAALPAPGGVEDALRAKQNIGRLMGAMDELNDTERDVLRLRELGGLTYRQIAEQTGKSEATIETALFRARRKAAAEYGELASGARCLAVQAQLLDVDLLTRAQRRRITRHLGRCMACERIARFHGAEELVPEPRLARIAGAMPLPGLIVRAMSSTGADLSPFVGKAAVAAAVTIGGATLVAGGQPATSDADAQAEMGGSKTTSAAAVAVPRRPVVLPSAPTAVRQVKAHRVAAVSERRAAQGHAPTVSVRPTTATPAPAPATPVAAPAPTPTTEQRAPEPEHTTSTAAPTSAPEQASALQDDVQPAADAVQETAGAVEGAVQQTTTAVQQTTAPVTQAVAPVTQAVTQAAKPPVQAVQNTVNTAVQSTTTTAQHAASSTGPTVKQTVQCLTSACHIGG